MRVVLKPVLVVLFLVIAQACSTLDWQGVAKNTERFRCNHLPSNEYEECLKEMEKGYSTYNEDLKELEKEHSKKVTF